MLAMFVSPHPAGERFDALGSLAGPLFLCLLCFFVAVPIRGFWIQSNTRRKYPALPDGVTVTLF